MSSDLLAELRATTRQALAADGGGDVVDQLDLGGLLVDTDLGGLGMGERELVLVGEELGRGLASSSFLPTAVLAASLLSAGAPATDPLLKGLAHSKFAVALSDADGVWLSTPSVQAASTDSGWHLTGRSWGLTGPNGSTSVLVAAAAPDGVGVFMVEISAVEVTPAAELDPGRGLAAVDFVDTPAQLVVGEIAATTALSLAYRRALLGVASEQVGIARASLELAVEYAKTRTQFGASIGSFQAIKHRAADVLLDVEMADALVAQAVESGDLSDAQLAFVVASRAAVFAVESCIHIHGGIGFTWEHSAHWYLRRARVNASLLGPSGAHRAAIAESAGLAAAEGDRR